MGAIVAAIVTTATVFFLVVLGVTAYHSGVNLFAWSQYRAMSRLGYEWVTPQRRYQAVGYCWIRTIRQSSDDLLWYAIQATLMDGTADDWLDWVSDIGFDNPIAAHAYAEVQGWRAQ